MSAAATEESRQDAAPVVRPVEWASVPRVNLLPPEILEGRRFRRVQVLLGLVVLLTVLLAAAATVWASGQVSTAQDELDDTTSRISALTTRRAQYAEVPRVTAQVDAATAARAEAMAGDVVWYRYLGDIRAALPGGVAMTSLGVTKTAAGAGATSTPLSATGIGTLTVEGTAPGYDSVSAWLDALDKIAGIDFTSLTSAAAGAGGQSSTAVSFTSSAVVTEGALSHLYDEGKTG